MKKTIKDVVNFVIFIFIYCICWHSVLIYFSIPYIPPENCAMMFMYFVALPVMVIVIFTIYILRDIYPFIIGIIRFFTSKKTEEKPRIMPKKRRKGHRFKNIDEKPTYEPQQHVKGNLFRKLGIDYRKPVKKEENDAFLPVLTEKENHATEKLEKKWESLIHELRENGTVKISRHSHHGQLRGVDILIHARRDLKRIGYEVEIVKKGYDGEIRLI